MAFVVSVVLNFFMLSGTKLKIYIIGSPEVSDFLAILYNHKYVCPQNTKTASFVPHGPMVKASGYESNHFCWNQKIPGSTPGGEATFLVFQHFML